MLDHYVDIGQLVVVVQLLVPVGDIGALVPATACPDTLSLATLFCCGSRVGQIGCGSC